MTRGLRAHHAVDLAGARIHRQGLARDGLGLVAAIFDEGEAGLQRERAHVRGVDRERAIDLAARLVELAIVERELGQEQTRVDRLRVDLERTIHGGERR